MHCIRNSILQHLRPRVYARPAFLVQTENVVKGTSKLMCTSAGEEHKDQIMSRVIALVKKYDKIDASKVTETADFQKDLSLDSLDRVELVMAFEEEFSIEIPDEKADKLTCCADVAKHIISETHPKPSDS